MAEADTAGRTPRRLVALLVVGYVLLLFAWAFANPPFAAPDESDHYLRAVGLAGGELLGRPTKVEPPPQEPPATKRWFADSRHDFRAVSVPAGLYASGLECNALHPEQSSGCLASAVPTTTETRQPTLVAHYEPVGYLPAAAFVRLASDAFDAVRAARTGQVVVVAALLALAFAVLASTSGLVSVIGPILAVTPTAVFIGAMVNPSGLEIASAIAFFAALLRLTRSDPPTWAWGAAAAAGATLALSRSPGPAWVVLQIALVALLAGRSQAIATLRRGGRAALAAGAVVAGAVCLSLLWSAVYGPRAGVGLTTWIHRLKPAVGVLPFRLTEEVGRFGWLDTPLPTLAVMAWQALVVGVLAVALVVGRPRERLAVLAAAAAGLAVPVIFSAWFSGLTVIGEAQGRHLLPAAVVVPLLAGEVLHRNRRKLDELGALGLLVVVPILVAAIQLVAWYWSGHRQAVGGGGPAFYFSRAEWSPPLGWWPWAAVAATGAGLLALAAFVGGPERALRRQLPTPDASRP